MERVLLLLWAALLAGGTLHRASAQALSDDQIVPKDIIIIEVLGEKDLSKEFRVSATGTINYFFLGEVKVAGKTTAAIRDLLTQKLNRDYLINPQVTVVKKNAVRKKQF